jgi:hypothetical protein
VTVEREATSGRGARRRTDALLDLWVLVPVLLLCWPLLTRGGHPFARDLVFTPRLPPRPEALGLGTGAPRAAPLDAVVAALSTVVDGAVLGRVAVVGVLAVAGWGAHRAVRTVGVPGRAAAGALAVWNPFVVERLGLGQWALLAGYAALFPLVVVLTAGDRTTRERRARCAPWLLLGALTPTGALLVGLTTVVLGVRRRADAGLLALAAAVQLPWLLPALLGSGSLLSDPAAVEVFAARAERAGPALLSLVGLGGIWDSLSVPGTREGWLGHLTTAVVVVALVVAARSVRRPAALAGPLWVLGLGSLAVAAATSVGPVADAVAALMGSVPGLGLLRDAQKWLAPFVVLAVLAVAVLVEDARRVARRRAPVLVQSVVVLAVVLPFALLPDGAVVVHRVLAPVHYPTDFDQVEAALAREPGDTQGALASAPWRLYRSYPWATEYATYDPSSRWFDVRVLMSDELVVGERVLGGEDPWAARVGAALAHPGAGTIDAVAREGVRWLLVHREDPDATALLDAVASDPGTTTVVDGRSLVLLRLAGTDVGAARAAAPAPWMVVLVALVDLAVLGALVLVAASRTSASGRERPVTLA